MPFLVDREVGGVQPLPSNSPQPITAQPSPPPGRYEFLPANWQRCLSPPEREHLEGMQDEQPVARGELNNMADRQRRGRREGNPVPDSWKLTELQTRSCPLSHKVKALEDVTHSFTILTDSTRGSRGGLGEGGGDAAHRHRIFIAKHTDDDNPF